MLTKINESTGKKGGQVFIRSCTPRSNNKRISNSMFITIFMFLIYLGLKMKVNFKSDDFVVDLFLLL